MLAEIGNVYLQGDFRVTEGRIIRIMLCESESAKQHELILYEVRDNCGQRANPATYILAWR